MKILIQIWLLLSLCAYGALAQDKIVKTNGQIISGKVKEVGLERIIYKIDDSENAAIFTIRKSDVSKIEFENGQVVDIQIQERSTVNKKMISNDLGRNLINISPLKALDDATGIGLSYERIIDKKGIFGLTLPISLLFSDHIFFANSSDNNGAKMLYVAPGLKIYPFGQRKVTYAVGPTFFYGTGDKPKYYYDNPNSFGYKSIYNERAGIVINNYINFQITPNFQISMNGGLGRRFYNYVDDNIDSNLSVTSITGEFNFSIGFRF